MTQVYTIQRALADSAIAYLNAEAQVLTHIKWLGRAKKQVVIDKLKGKSFIAKDIMTEEVIKKQGIDRSAMMKVVAVDTVVYDYNLQRLKDIHAPIFSLAVYFMQNPEDIIQSKKAITEAESKILNDMQKVYNRAMISDIEKLLRLNSQLSVLKHGFNIIHQSYWQWNIDTILSDDFMSMGLRCNIISIC